MKIKFAFIFNNKYLLYTSRHPAETWHSYISWRVFDANKQEVSVKGVAAAEEEVGPSDRTLRASHSDSCLRCKENIITISSSRSWRQSRQTVEATLTVGYAHDLECSFWHSLIVFNHKILIRFNCDQWIYPSTIYFSLKVVTLLFISCYVAHSNYFSSLFKVTSNFVARYKVSLFRKIFSREYTQEH